jgi:TetR/AcrR family transcriptional regulator, mexJK operon transcriptional repressor
MTKRQAIISAAETLFLRDGMAFTVDATAALAGVAKQTVYNSFPTKQAVVEAVIAARIEQLTAAITDAPETQSVQISLTELARRYMEMILEPSGIALVRMLVSVADAPKAQQFTNNGPAALHAKVSAYLDDRSARGLLRKLDPDLAAEHFFGLLKGNLQLLTLLRQAEAPDAIERDRRIQAAVDVFLRAYAPS